MTYYLVPTPAPAWWDAFVAAHPDGHLLQYADWGRLKAAFGWSAEIIAIKNDTGAASAGAQILYRRLPLRLGQMGYIPAGPLFAEDDDANRLLWRAIDAAVRRRRVAFLKIESCNWYRPRPDLPGRLEQAGLRPSPHAIQPPRTLILDISVDEEEILRQMNQSTRYKCRLGPKKAVEVREGTGTDIASFNALMAVTGERDAFGVHVPAYYQMAYDLFAPDGRCALLMASYKGQDLAGVMVFRSGPNAYYFYGASSDAERNRMPTYIVQWEAIRWAKRQGAVRYDLWGIPDAAPEVLEAQFQGRRDGLWGVYGFKRGFGGQIVRSLGAWDKPYNALVYALYRWYVGRRGEQR